MKPNLSPFVIGTLVLGTFVAPLSVYAQRNEINHGQDTPADGRGDRARHVPPPAASGGAVTTGNGISYHNGPVLHAVNVYYIWYGNWGQDPAANAILTGFAQHIGGSPYFNINTTYGDTSANVPNAVTYKGSYSDSGSQGTSLNDSSIAAIVSSALASGTLGPADPNGVYFVLTAPGVNETTGFLTKYCGWHTAGTFNGTTLQYSFVGDAAGPSLGNCAWQTDSSPNNDPGADAMVSVVAHELEESASDPHLNAWYDSSGQENADKCAWTFGTTYHASNGSLANMALGGMNFLIQQNWVNAGGGYCDLSYVASPDFSVSVSGSQTVLPGGTSGNYTLSSTALNGFAGAVTWTISQPLGITATPSSFIASSGTFTLTAGSGQTPGTYSIPITAASDTLTHTTAATLVVSAPTFTLGITPGSQTATRPTAGNTKAVTYTVTVTPVAGFTSGVNLTVAGGTTGISPAVSPASLPSGSGTAVLAVTVSSSAKKGNRTLTVTASGGGVTKQATATLMIH